ncbi:hypothetical protein QBC46DRAFT_274352 [Diplogelasinospora grovesii]|uniref:Myb-like domain-containing protein n=1 Tax=Diplogelasinospora grovesii TaxID=303347 RepID=A0AAN6RYU1_9PEZI|nr:hypothetical protein QBC46DRAFT_274352 [Diplogelasinospora grovesii]
MHAQTYPPPPPLYGTQALDAAADADHNTNNVSDQHAQVQWAGGATDHDPSDPLPPVTYNYGTWTEEEDIALVSARKKGLNWFEIQRAHFPSKTGNACRKRYERLMEHRGANNFDARKLERLSGEYMKMRKQIWSGLAAKMNMRWELVEQQAKQCMSAGLKTIQSKARSHTNRSRRENNGRLQKSRNAEELLVRVGPTSPSEEMDDDDLDIDVPNDDDPEVLPEQQQYGGPIASAPAPLHPRVSVSGYLNGNPYPSSRTAASGPGGGGQPGQHGGLGY